MGESPGTAQAVTCWFVKNRKPPCTGRYARLSNDYEK